MSPVVVSPAHLWLLQGVEYIAPLIVRGLTRADIYCKAYSSIFQENVTAHGQGKGSLGRVVHSVVTLHIRAVL